VVHAQLLTFGKDQGLGIPQFNLADVTDTVLAYAFQFGTRKRHGENGLMHFLKRQSHPVQLFPESVSGLDNWRGKVQRSSGRKRIGQLFTTLATYLEARIIEHIHAFILLDGGYKSIPFRVSNQRKRHQ
jgi:hypothetical protein